MWRGLEVDVFVWVNEWNERGGKKKRCMIKKRNMCTFILVWESLCVCVYIAALRQVLSTVEEFLFLFFSRTHPT